MNTILVKNGKTKVRCVFRKIYLPKVKYCDFCGSNINYIPFDYEGFEICDRCNLKYKNQ